jgi:AcrR family transcriptional regulator
MGILWGDGVFRMDRADRRDKQVALVSQQILEAAARAFAEQGFGATTMAHIAEHAGYAPSALYKYFPSKEAIVSGLVTLLVTGVRQLFEQALPMGLTLTQKYEMLLMRQVEFAEGRREAITFMLAMLDSDAPASAGSGKRIDTSADATFTDALARWLRREASAEDLSGRRPEDVACFMWNVSNGFFRRAIRAGRPLAPLVPTVLDFTLHGLGVGGVRS